jgi:hypothetical protein
MIHKYEEFFDEKIEYAIKSGKTIKDLALEFKMDRHMVSRQLRKRGFKTNLHGKLPINNNIFNTIDNEEKAYWLGFLYADGNVHLDKKKKNYKIELSLKESDLEHIEKFKKFLSSNNKISYREKVKAYRISIGNNIIGKDLISLGCFIKKSNILKFPTKEQVPKELQKHFVRGYLDGDGSVCLSTRIKSKGRISLTVSFLGTKEFLEKMIYNLNFPKNNLTITNKNSEANCFTLQYGNYHSYKILEYLYENSNIYLKRKYQKYLQAKLLFKDNINEKYEQYSKNKIQKLEL